MNLLQFLQDENEIFSSNRLAFLLWAIGVLVVWVISGIKTGSLQEIPESVVVIIGIFMGGKVVQRFGEKKHDDSPGDVSGKNK